MIDPAMVNILAAVPRMSPSAAVNIEHSNIVKKHSNIAKKYLHPIGGVV